MDITVTIPDEGQAVLESWLGVGQIKPWLQHAIDNKLRQRLDASIVASTNLNPKKLTAEQKIAELDVISLPTRVERDAVSSLESK